MASSSNSSSDSVVSKRKFESFPKPKFSGSNSTLKGRKVKRDPIMSTGSKVGIAVAWIFAAVLVTVAVLASHGMIPLPSWAVMTLKVGAGIYGSSLGLFSLGLIPWAICEKKERDKAEMRNELIAENPEPLSVKKNDHSLLILDEEKSSETEAPKRRQGDSIIPNFPKEKKERPPLVSLTKQLADVHPNETFYDFVDEVSFKSIFCTSTKNRVWAIRYSQYRG